MWQMFSAQTPLVLIGCGNMGRAMGRGWLSAGLDASAFWGVDPVAATSGAEGLPATSLVASVDDLPKCSPAVVVLAVKPQIMNDVVASIRHIITSKTLIISVAAGTAISAFTSILGEDIKMVRAMPNTPASIGKGITGLCANSHVGDAERSIADALLSAVGDVVWLEGEHQMNTVTAVSGSGPAYVFHMVEALAAAGEKEGLSAEVAMQLARATIVGAGALLEASSDSASKLRQDVTSPGGTTAAGLDELRATGDLAELMRRTVRAARKRGQELSE